MTYLKIEGLNFMMFKRLILTFILFAVINVCCNISLHAASVGEINKLWNAYYATAKYYNSSLSNKEVEEIINNVIYYSYKYALDPRFVMAVVTIESMFNPRAVSSVGAMGLGQIMPENLRAYGVTKPFAPNENIRIMVRMLRLNYDRFSHLPYTQRVHNTLAAYNAGYGAVLKYNGIPPYKETQNYVCKVIGLWRKFCGLK